MLRNIKWKLHANRRAADRSGSLICTTPIFMWGICLSNRRRSFTVSIQWIDDRLLLTCWWISSTSRFMAAWLSRIFCERSIEWGLTRSALLFFFFDRRSALLRSLKCSCLSTRCCLCCSSSIFLAISTWDSLLQYSPSMAWKVLIWIQLFLKTSKPWGKQMENSLHACWKARQGTTFTNESNSKSASSKFYFNMDQKQCVDIR